MGRSIFVNQGHVGLFLRLERESIFNLHGIDDHMFIDQARISRFSFTTFNLIVDHVGQRHVGIIFFGILFSLASSFGLVFPGITRRVRWVGSP